MKGGESMVSPDSFSSTVSLGDEDSGLLLGGISTTIGGWAVFTSKSLEQLLSLLLLVVVLLVSATKQTVGIVGILSIISTLVATKPMSCFPKYYKLSGLIQATVSFTL